MTAYPLAKMRHALLVFALISSGCTSDEGLPTWARATGWFSAFEPRNVSCALVGGRSDTELWVSFIVGQSSSKLLLPLIPKGERAQRDTALKYGSNGQTTRGLIEFSRGDTIVDPRMKDEAMRAQALATRTSLFFPVTARRVSLTPGHLCEVNLDDGLVDQNDCIDVPDDSALEDAHFWCGIGVLTNPAWSE